MDAGAGGGMRAITEFWRGGVPLGRAFWHWGVFGLGAREGQILSPAA